jgi:hypothetical protein
MCLRYWNGSRWLHCGQVNSKYEVRIANAMISFAHENSDFVKLVYIA